MRRSPALVILMLGAVAGWPSGAGAQTPPPPPVHIRVFIDCSNTWCDSEYLRNELPLIDHVLDREAADLHILITSQSTGAGGTEYTLAFIGRLAFTGANDTLTYVEAPAQSSDTTRAGLVRTIRLGLVRYISHSSVADAINVTFGGQKGETKASAPDPWNRWVMRVGFSGYGYVESQSDSLSLSANASANRITDAWKIKLSSSLSYRQSGYDLGDGETFTTITRSSNASGLVVKSLGPRWSVGARAAFSSSTYTNQKRTLSAAPAIEYDLFPYSQSTRKLLTLQYSLGVTDYRYSEVTIYGKTGETLPNQKLTLRFDSRQPWGQLNLSLDGIHHLSLNGKYRVEAGSGIELRVAKGLSIDFWGWASWIRDQLYLPRGDATTEEILVRQRQLKTSYRVLGVIRHLVHLRLSQQQHRQPEVRELLRLRPAGGWWPAATRPVSAGFRPAQSMIPDRITRCSDERRAARSCAPRAGRSSA